MFGLACFEILRGSLAHQARWKVEGSSREKTQVINLVAIRDESMPEDISGIDLVYMIGAALQGAKELVKEGELSLGETAEIELDFPQNPFIKAVLGPTDFVQILHIDQNHKLTTNSLVDKPSVVVLIDENGLTHLWDQLNEYYEKLTGKEAEDGTAITMIAEIQETLSKKYDSDCGSDVHLISHLMIASFTMAI